MNHDALHTLDLPQGNKTSDDELLAICAREDRILISKDLEFADSFLLKRQPSRLLLFGTGNVGYAELGQLFREHLPKVVQTFERAAFVELDRSGMIVHEITSN